MLLESGLSGNAVQQQKCQMGRKMRIAAILFFLICMGISCAGAEEIRIPIGTTIEGETMFGAYAAEPGSNPGNPNPFLAIRALQNPKGVGGKEIPLKDCIFLGDVFSDLTVNRAFFKASRIKCSNAKEMNGSAIKGYAVDMRDNKLGLQGRVGTAVPKAVEVPPGAKIYLIIVEAASITVK